MRQEIVNRIEELASELESSDALDEMQTSAVLQTLLASYGSGPMLFSAFYRKNMQFARMLNVVTYESDGALVKLVGNLLEDAPLEDEDGGPSS